MDLIAMLAATLFYTLGSMCAAVYLAKVLINKEK